MGHFRILYCSPLLLFSIYYSIPTKARNRILYSKHVVNILIKCYLMKESQEYILKYIEICYNLKCAQHAPTQGSKFHSSDRLRWVKMTVRQVEYLHDWSNGWLRISDFHISCIGFVYFRQMNGTFGQVIFTIHLPTGQVHSIWNFEVCHFYIKSIQISRFDSLISINTLLKFIPKCQIYNIPTLVQIMAWCRPGNKPLSEPMMTILLMHICVIRPQWAKQWELNIALWFSSHLSAHLVMFMH